ncbi:uncharacterized protein F5891DRAFT_1241405 [Suillus fuscotomentosus]|uniref:Uncharacterized protein n=1 Tax=Suillus fuscotomentosus TaxID=1912939 RepID=A0AAD4E139_9AGAM|nr:uncharacterized protein F5891DRAFT_1241405 [Suillus fuscotomentosus]KAG1897697.1 hypothetical protein F5891DRAFT_1241405 [Suillus fuscotomentosus]
MSVVGRSLAPFTVTDTDCSVFNGYTLKHAWTTNSLALAHPMRSRGMLGTTPLFYCITTSTKDPFPITHPAMMATKSEVIDNSKSIASSPPSDVPPVLPRIRDLVSTTNLSPSSIELIANKCAYDLTAAELSDLLQTLNIEGHTALYWAIVNHRQEGLSAFRLFISKLSSECSSDLRLACMRTNDHALFLKLNLQNTDAQDKSLRQFLGCPPDEIEVHDARGLDDN